MSTTSFSGDNRHVDNNVFGAWLAEHQKTRKLSDTKLAAALGVSGPTISRWKTGTVTPRDEAVLDVVADYFNEDRATVYAMAGRGRVGSDTKGLLPEFAEIAFGLQAAHESLTSPVIKNWFFGLIKRKMAEALTETEAAIEMHEELQQQGEKR